MRYYQVPGYCILGIKEKAAAPYIREVNAYYLKNKESISQEAGSAIKYVQSDLGNIGNAVAYMDSLIDYQRSIGNYPGNYRQKAILCWNRPT